jgi:ABC-type protease/lipase transport system fused ATPase/permease subunit
VLTLIMVIFLALLNFVQAIRMAILSDIADFLDEKLSSFLINISFKTNIAKMQKKFDDEKVIEAAKIAFAHQMILKLPKGYETDIGMWGTKLSAGQRQRIALARAFYGDPKLVILDEPNSNLDTEGEAALAHCLVEAKKRKITTIIISHRQQIIENVDKILVLVAGEAKAFGDKEEVIKKMTNNGQLN